MNQTFYRIYLYSTIIISFVIGIPYLFYINDDSSWSGNMNAGWAFGSCMFIYSISVCFAKIVSKEKILFNKVYAIICVILVFLLLCITGFLIYENDFSIIGAILFVLSTLSFCLCVIVSISFVIKIIQNRKSIKVDFASVIYLIFFVLTSIVTLCSAYQYLIYLNYANEYLYYDDFFFYLSIGISFINIGILILSLLISFITLAFKNKKWVVFIGSIFFSILLFATLFLISINISDMARDKTVYISNRKPYEPSDDITVEYAKSYKEDDNDKQDVERSSEEYVRTVTLPDGIKPRRFGFLAKNTAAEEDSIALAIERYNKSFKYDIVTGYFPYPDPNLDYLSDNPVVFINTRKIDLFKGDLSQYKMTAYLEDSNSAEVLWGLFLQYKDLLYKLIPYDVYKSKRGECEVKLLLQAYDDLSKYEDSFSFSKLYEFCTREDLTNEEKFSYIDDYMSKRSYEMNVESDLGSTMDYFKIYSFWARRWHDGNLDVCYTILSEMNEHYEKEKAKK